MAGVFSRVCTRFGIRASFKQDRHGAGHVQIGRRDRIPVLVEAEDDPRQTGLEIFEIQGQTQDGHHFGGHRDVEAALPRNAFAVEADFDAPQGAIVQIDHPRPQDVLGVDVTVVAVEQVIVEHSRGKVVRRADGVHIAGEVEIDVLHRHDLGIATAGGPALDAERRAQRGLAQRGDHRLADLGQTLGEPDVDGGLAFTRRSRRDGGAEDELAVGAVFHPVEHVEVDLGLVLAVQVEIVGAQPKVGGHVDDRFQRRLLGDLNVALHPASPSLLGSTVRPFIIVTTGSNAIPAA